MAEAADSYEEIAQQGGSSSGDNREFTSYEGVTKTGTPEEDVAPMYRMIGESRIPVSKHRGPLWHSRYDQGRSAMSKHQDAWDEAYRYYRHDHTRQAPVASREPDDAAGAKPLVGSFDSTENLVFANTAALVPMLFTKNPDAEFSVEDDEDQDIARVTERLVNFLAAKKTPPGINLKRKAKRNIVSTTLTNVGWFEVGYTLREQSAEAAYDEIKKLSLELQQAKSQKDIKEVEGKLMALEATIDLLTPAGPWVKVRRPNQVIVDTSATDLDLSGECNWVMIEDFMFTALLRARYGRKKPDSEEWESVFEPSHVLKTGVGPESGERGQTDNFQLFSYSTAEYSKYGYADQRTFLAAQMTKVIYVWDRVTRRCELYNANDWCYPLWVWDDPYRLDQFYTLVPMEFHTDPITMYAKGEVTYYLDQQDDVNLINAQWAKVRQFAAGKVVYDKNSLKDTGLLEGIIAGTTDSNAVGVDLPEGKKIGDVVSALLPPVADTMKFFDKKPVLEAIDRLSGVASVQRGVEYKTNTTNKAIESYESQIQTRADEKMDAIEDSIGTVLWLVAQMCLQFMTQQDVATLLGEQHASKWKRMSPEDIRTTFTPRVVGGSTLKPTSRAKKEQAMQISQVVGQFASATPIAAVVALKVLSKAFDNVTISLEDWELIYKGIMQAASGEQGAEGKAGAPPPQQGAPQAGTNGAKPPAQQPAAKVKQGAGLRGQSIDGLAQMVQEAAQIIDALPPEMKQQIGTELSRGVPMAQIAGGLLQQVQRGMTQ